MKILVIGSGAREHALAWALKRSPGNHTVFVAPGNAGTSSVAENVAIKADDLAGLVEFARREAIDLTVVGPEGPLMLGVVDRFRDAGLACYGPTRAAARLEGSKAFAKEFMQRHGIPTARFAVFDDAAAARAFARELGAPVVIKADGLAAGKGVVVAADLDTALAAIDDMLVAGKFGASGHRVVVEEFIDGEEVSVHAVCAGTECVLLPGSQDHKRAYDGDRGPNTGGMGAIAPVPWMTDADMEHVRTTVIEPVLAGMEKEGARFTGTLYAGLMWTPAGPKVLEFNVRFGDPETEVLMPLIEDAAAFLHDAAHGRIPARVATRAGAAAAVVIAARGYPDSPETGVVIDGLDSLRDENVVAFHGGTRREDHRIVSSGGRILTVGARGSDLRSALDAAYDGVRRIHIEGSFHRGDIGRRHLSQPTERTNG